MEVWLESLSMHLSVGMPLPPDLLFDIQHYRGLSPSSSGSTTPEGIPSGHRSPALEPIREGKMATTKKSTEKMYKSNDKLQKSNDVVKPIIKVSSAENLLNNRRDNSLKPIIKVSSSDALIKKAAPEEFYTKSCEDVNEKIEIVDDSKDFPNYENIDFLRNDAAFVGDAEKPIGIQKLNETELKKDSDKKNCTDNNLKDNKFNVHLRKVPKNFTRNRFVKEIKENALREEEANSVRDKLKFLGKTRTFDVKPLPNVPGKVSNLNLDSIGLKTNLLPSQVTEKYVNSSKNINLSKPQTYQRSFSNLETVRNDSIPDVVSSTLITDPSCSSRDKSDPKPTLNTTRSSLMRRRYTRDSDDSLVPKRTPILQRRCPNRSLDEEICDNSKAQSKSSCEIEKPSLLTKLTPILQRRTGFLKLEPENATNTGKKAFGGASSGSIVRNMVSSLNRKGGIGFGNRGNYGRSSLKVTGSPRVDLKGVGRSCSPTEEYTAL